MTEPTVTVISIDKFVNEYQDKLGSLMFPAEWYDSSHRVDLKKLRKNIPPLPKASRIMRVLVATDNNPEFLNKQNKQVPYKTSVCADKSLDGAYYKNYPEMNFSMWAVDYPAGNVVVVASKL